MPLLLLPTLLLAHPFFGATGTAEAHPENLLIGQALQVELRPGALALHGKLEIPALRLAKEAAAEGRKDLGERRRVEFRDALHVRFDGQPLPLTERTLENATHTGEPGILVMEVALDGILPADRGTLTISNGTYPDENCVFATEVLVDGDLVVERSSLASVTDGSVRKNINGAWVSDETRGREVLVELRPATLWERSRGLFPLPLRLAGALPTPIWLAAIPLLVLLAVPILLWSVRKNRIRRSGVRR